MAYNILLNLIFGFFFVRKVLKLDKLGDNLEVNIPRKDWFKFLLILLAIISAILHIVLAYTFSDYW